MPTLDAKKQPISDLWVDRPDAHDGVTVTGSTTTLLTANGCSGLDNPLHGVAVARAPDTATARQSTAAGTERRATPTPSPTRAARRLLGRLERLVG